MLSSASPGHATTPSARSASPPGSLDKVYKTEDLCGGEDVYFSATGASTGEMLKGVNFYGGGAYTHSLVMRSRSGTIRWIDSTHNFARLDKMMYR